MSKQGGLAPRNTLIGIVGRRLKVHATAGDRIWFVENMVYFTEESLDQLGIGMSPRQYQQTTRKTMTEATRQRIVEAAVALHAEKGIAATTVADIAHRADVGVGTIYYHYPTYDDIVRACGAHMRAVTQPPQPASLDNIRPLDSRVEHMVQELFAYYERYPSFERGRCDRDKLPVLAEAVGRREQGLRTFVHETYKSVPNNQEFVRMTLALIDFAVYRALTADGLSTDAAAIQVSQVILAWLQSNRITITP